MAATMPAARRLDIGVLDADVFFSDIEEQSKDATSGLPVRKALDTPRYSTRTFKGGH